MALWICSQKYTHLNMTGSLYEVDDFGEGSYINGKTLFCLQLYWELSTVVIQLMRTPYWKLWDKIYPLPQSQGFI
jgi:peptide/nickel transport system permease protein